jgi:hypothetical protein
MKIPTAILYSRIDKEMCLAMKLTFLRLHPKWQRDYEVWDLKTKTRFIQSMLLHLSMNPLWVITNPEDDCQDMLDGLHRSTTAALFLNNKFGISKKYLVDQTVIKALSVINKDILMFEDLPSALQQKFRDYEFDMNILDESYHYDADKRWEMWYTLNRSSILTNNFEYYHNIFWPLFDKFKIYKDDLNSLFFAKKDYRGDIEEEIMDILVLSMELPNSWGSIATIKKEFLETTIGGKSLDVANYIEQHGDNIDQNLKMMKKIIIDLKDRNIFSKNKKIFKKNYLPYKLIIGRLIYTFQNNSALYYRHIAKIIENIQERVTDVDDIQETLGCNSRNAVFQKKLIKLIDEIINSSYEESKQKRFFSKEDKENKLKEQDNKCSICKNALERYDADHIKEWKEGGTTTYDNLQLLCIPCHKEKTRKYNNKN